MKSSEPATGTVLYDAACHFCVSLAKGLGPTLHKAGFELAPLQDQHAQTASLRSEPGADKTFDSMVVLTPDGRALESAEALVFLAKRIRWARPLALVAKLPFGMRLLDRTYAWVARNRFCLSGQCPARASRRWPAWLPLLSLLAGAFTAWTRMENWLWMWLLSFSLLFGLKWSVWWNARPATTGLSWYRHCSFLFGWVGMDAVRFLRSKPQPRKRSLQDWARGIVNTVAGAALIWIVARFVPPGYGLMRAWTGLVGLILLLHFGLFHLVALGWQTRGVSAEPIMRSPLRSTSPSEFWGRRWNLGFRYLSHTYVFQPLRPLIGSAGATVAAFLASGVIHDLVISLPAQGGYLLPTAYFAIQAAGVLIRALRSRQTSAAGCGMERARFHVDRDSGSCHALVSRGVHQQRSCANVAFDGGVLACGV